MLIEPFYKLCPEMKAFIKFDIIINKKIVPIVGHELYCCDPECDCRLATIIFYDSRTDKCLANIQYGWDDYDYYIKEKFVKSDVDGFINGCLNILETPTSKNLSILESFKVWLTDDQKTKKQLFAERYQKCKLVAKNKGFNSEQSMEYFLENMGDMLKSGVFKDLF